MINFNYSCLYSVYKIKHDVITKVVVLILAWRKTISLLNYYFYKY